MRIAQVRVFVLRLDHDEPYLGAFPGADANRRPEVKASPRVPADNGYRVRAPWRSLYSPRFETVLVQVVAENGKTGWGEALAPVGPEVPAHAVASLIRPVLQGMSFSGPRAAWYQLRDLMRERGHLVGHQADALAAVDTALWDLHGNILGVPVAALLGGQVRDRVPSYVSGLPREDDPGRVELARQWVDRGFRLIKLHLGHSVDADIATVDAVLETHPDLRVAVDAHWAYSLADAARLASALEQRRVAFLEAPLQPEDVEGHRDLARRTALPIAVGETLRNRFEFTHWLGRRAIGLVQPDIGRTGITEATSIAEIASGYHVAVAPHHSVGLGVALAAGIHTAAAIETTPFFEYQPTTFSVANRLLTEPIDMDGDQFVIPAGPGLGVHVDENVVAANGVEL